MKKQHLTWVVVIGVIVLIALWLVSSFNSFIRLGENVNTAWAQVENQYQRRYDLIPNLVKTVEGIASQERAVFQGVADARAKVGQFTVTPEILANPEAFAQFQNIQGELSSALTRLLATVENYPTLRSNENFLALQNQLEGTENRISVERKRFNDETRAYNIKAKAIPGRWLVGMFGLESEKVLFEAIAGADKAPAVEFNIGE